MEHSGASKAGSTLPSGASRDYNAMWESLYRRALRNGLTDSMARFVASAEVHDQQLADRGLTPVGAGDIEVVY